MRLLALAVACLWCAQCANGQVRTNALVHILSGSRQFAVHGVPLPQPESSPSHYMLKGDIVPVRPIPSSASREDGRIQLDPSFLAISCERIKKALLSELEMHDAWRGQIIVHIQFTPRTNQPVDIQASLFNEGWQYRVTTPDEIERKRLIRAIVHVLLLEMAHRRDPPHQAEIPLWLSEGLTQHLLSASSLELTPRPFTHSFMAGGKASALELARERARMREACSFNELSQPTPDMLIGGKWERYQISAQLFLAELLRIKGGKNLLSAFIARLPGNLNWQTTFLQVYRNQFHSLLEVEKWWSLCLANAQGLTEPQGWSYEDTWAKLDEIMHVPAMIRSGTNTLPARARLSMSRFVEYYDFQIQQRTMREKIGQLKTLAFVASPDLRPLVQRCAEALESYLMKRELAGLNRDKRGASGENLRFFAHKVMASLDTLENEIERARNPGVRGQR